MKTPQLESMAHNPLGYVSDQQKRGYRTRVIKKAILWILVTVTMVSIDVLLITWFDKDAVGFLASSGSNHSERSKRWDEGFVLAWMIFEVGALPYGLYLLATIKRQMSKIALKDLGNNNPLLQSYINSIKSRKNKSVQVRVSKTSDIFLKVFIGMLVAFVICMAGLLVFAMVQG